MKVELNSSKSKTWDGLRALYAFFTLCSLGLFFWLGFHESFLKSEAKILLLVPITFFAVFFVLTFFAKDESLKKTYSWIRALNI